jgi:hypothetical protein
MSELDVTNDKSLNSPRSTLSKQSRIRRQALKLTDMKNEAKSRLQGLQSFQLLMWSKARLSEQLSDADLLAEFTKRFGVALPLKHIDLVLVSGLAVEEKLASEHADEAEGENVEEVRSQKSK